MMVMGIGIQCSVKRMMKRSREVEWGKLPGSVLSDLCGFYKIPKLSSPPHFPPATLVNDTLFLGRLLLFLLISLAMTGAESLFVSNAIDLIFWWLEC